MEMYYVATRERYALVPAADEASAWVGGHEVLHNLHVELYEETGLETPVEIRTVRLATLEEIANWRWNEETLAEEEAEFQASRRGDTREPTHFSRHPTFQSGRRFVADDAYQEIL